MISVCPDRVLVATPRPTRLRQAVMMGTRARATRDYFSVPSRVVKSVAP